MSRAVLALYRWRGPVLFAATGILIALALFGPLVQGSETRLTKSLIAGTALVGWLACGVLTSLGPRLLPARAIEVVTSPVRGRWLGMNSPASKVPSHGVRMYGQAYAIDLVFEPVDAARPTFGSGPAMRANEDYPAFGQPVIAMVDGTVVTASDWRRDHRARSTMLGIIYMMVEGVVREFGGPGFIVGNHVTIRTDSGVYALVAHLKRGSVTVAVGDTVRAGTVIGECGNSGNSSEPHVHAQLMDRASLRTAQGIPLAFANISLGEQPAAIDGLPENAEHMTAN